MEHGEGRRSIQTVVSMKPHEHGSKVIALENLGFHISHIAASFAE